MASRFKTRVSFGAFANIRTQVQHNISTNAMYSSMRRLLLILNNNFAYIVNTWNLFTKSNYVTDYQLFTSTKNETSDTSEIVYKGDTKEEQPDSVKTIQYYLDKIDLLNRRLDNIQYILSAAGAKPQFVSAEIGFYFKNNNTTLYSGYDLVKHWAERYSRPLGYIFGIPVGKKWFTRDHYWYANYNVSQREYNNYIQDTTHLCATKLHRFGRDKIPVVSYYQKDSFRGNTNAGVYGYGFKVPSGKYFTNDIKIFQGAQLEFEFPITTQLEKIYGGLQTLSGSVTLVMVISGRHNGVFDGSYIELKNGVTI